ncbi:hypothetical protein ABKA04_003405 [Annulohypoxylon sp. FPYF3050]
MDAEGNGNEGDKSGGNNPGKTEFLQQVHKRVIERMSRFKQRRATPDGRTVDQPAGSIPQELQPASGQQGGQAAGPTDQGSQPLADATGRSDQPGSRRRSGRRPRGFRGRGGKPASGPMSALNITLQGKNFLQGSFREGEALQGVIEAWKMQNGGVIPSSLVQISKISDRDLMLRQTSMIERRADAELEEVVDDPSTILPLRKKRKHRHRGGPGPALQHPENNASKVCGNCRKHGHVLSQCPGPVDGDGFVPGCPIHNTTRHSLDLCFSLPEEQEAQRQFLYQHLIVQRQFLPPIRCTHNWATIVEQLHSSRSVIFDESSHFPFTRVYSRLIAPRLIEMYDFSSPAVGQLGADIRTNTWGSFTINYMYLRDNEALGIEIVHPVEPCPQPAPAVQPAVQPGEDVVMEEGEKLGEDEQAGAPDAPVPTSVPTAVPTAVPDAEEELPLPPTLILP